MVAPGARAQSLQCLGMKRLNGGRRRRQMPRPAARGIWYRRSARRPKLFYIANEEMACRAVSSY